MQWKFQGFFKFKFIVVKPAMNCTCNYFPYEKKIERIKLPQTTELVSIAVWMPSSGIIEKRSWVHCNTSLWNTLHQTSYLYVSVLLIVILF